MGTSERPGDREVTLKDLPGILGGLGFLVVFGVLVGYGHPYLAIGFVAIAAVAMPRDQREAMGREVQRQDRTPVGRLMKIIQIPAGLLLLYAFARGLFGF